MFDLVGLIEALIALFLPLIQLFSGFNFGGLFG